MKPDKNISFRSLYDVCFIRLLLFSVFFLGRAVDVSLNYQNLTLVSCLGPIEDSRQDAV